MHGTSLTTDEAVDHLPNRAYGISAYLALASYGSRQRPRRMDARHVACPRVSRE